MEFVQQEITISLTRFARKETPSTIPAHVCGDLAYHGSLMADSCWSVTHVPTGCGIADFIPNEATAQRIISMALDSGLDWSQTDPEKITADKARSRGFIAAVNQYLGR